MKLDRRSILVGSAIALLALWFFPHIVSKRTLYTVTQVFIFGLFAISFNLMFGYLGLLSFGHAAYFGVGAYTVAILMTHFPGMSSLSGLVLGCLAGGVFGLVIGSFCVRLKGTYFAMLTLAFGQLVFGIAWKWRSVTRGDDGFGDFADRTVQIFGSTFSSTDTVVLFHLVTSISVVVGAIVWIVMSSTPFGTIVTSIKQNEVRAANLGINTYATKLVVYVIAAVMAGLAGALSSIVQNFVSTSSVDWMRSTDAVVMATVGGAANYLGPVLGATLLVFGGDFLSAYTDRWQLIMGAIFMFVVLFAPRGIAGAIADLCDLIRSWTVRPLGNDATASEVENAGR